MYFAEKWCINIYVPSQELVILCDPQILYTDDSEMFFDFELAYSQVFHLHCIYNIFVKCLHIVNIID